MTFGESIQSGFSRYAQFAGRATRSEYWFWQLFMMLTYIATLIAGAIVGDQGVMTILAALVFILPSISVLVRRLHDTNRSGWWYWIAMIPLVGAIILLVYMLEPSAPGTNEYDLR